MLRNFLSRITKWFHQIYLPPPPGGVGGLCLEMRLCKTIAPFDLNNYCAADPNVKRLSDGATAFHLACMLPDVNEGLLQELIS